ncbi:unnamed protein product [Lupinus luteus]|uniref:Reverse transcriptase Ty1/copia-type domain-containing protein n=1 Tax=Lupinus luteus TaxID=3873 RepID=A0AAV1YGC9_LUPLU
MFQLDVKSAFLHGPLQEEVYVQQPPGYIIEGKEHLVYKLSKALYGLKQAPRAWNKRIDSFLFKQQFEKCEVEHGVYVKESRDGNLVIICLYVDDLLITGSNPRGIAEVKRVLEAEFEMTDLGKLSYFLGMEFSYTPTGLLMHQSKYAKELLIKYNMNSCNPVSSPVETNLRLTNDEGGEAVDATQCKQIVGSLRFLCNTRPDLIYGVGLVSRFMSNPKKSHMLAAKRLLRYVKGTTDFGVLFPLKLQKPELELTGYADSDFGGDLVERKSTSGYLFLLNGAAVSWCSKKQPVIALSNCEAEYISSSYAACQAVWLEELIKEMKIKIRSPLQLKVDNISAISLSKNPVSHGRSKHIEVRFHFLRNLVTKKRLKLEYCRTELQLADAFTKALKIGRFEELRKKMGIESLRNLS